MKQCIKCAVSIHPDRLAILPHTTTCAACSDTPAYKGMMSYGHKTGGAVQPMLPDTYRSMKRYTSRRGKRSNLGSFLNHA